MTLSLLSPIHMGTDHLCIIKFDPCVSAKRVDLLSTKASGILLLCDIAGMTYRTHVTG
jgi:hypothetical protein